ncbi:MULTISPECIES: tripartite tricarboxylate transporter substrate-binding protein [Rhodomicrobium]|uniref:Bug family tripartite tricarboxylate transporter substrate binding protein n=1 Tax=Rhodomicrobium TaxID=1068 RepID=UPI0014828DAA|nr:MULTISPECIES: tripartite tricarboxylate transporter substrate-binding protein [Rhodomicrobium]
MIRMNSPSIALLAACAALAATGPAGAEGWQPSKAVEIIVPAGAGGASDQMARMLQAAIQKHGLMKEATVVTLKGGASGAEGLIDIKSSPPDGQKFIIAQSSMYTLPLSTNIPFNWRELTPIAIIALDEFVLWNNAAAPEKTVKDFLAAAKATPMKMGGTGSKREDHILTAFMEQKAGVKFAYIPYKSGGEAATQLVGNHTNANVNNPSENVAVWRSGQVRALCLFDTQRMDYKTKVTADQSWADIPTCKEEGLDIDYTMPRAIFLAGKAPPEQVAYYTDLFKKIAATPDYSEYMANQALKPVFIEGEDMKKFLETDEAKHKALMATAGFLAGSN